MYNRKSDVYETYVNNIFFKGDEIVRYFLGRIATCDNVRVDIIRIH